MRIGKSNLIVINRHQPARRIFAGLVVILAGALSSGMPAQADETIARVWNEQLLDAIRHDTPRPTVHARNLFHMSAAIYDVWAAFDPVAKQIYNDEKIDTAGMTQQQIDDTIHEAISYAAYRVIDHRFVSGPAGIGPGHDHTETQIFIEMVVNQGLDPGITTTVGNSAAAIGNRMAQTIINHGLADGARENFNYITEAGMYPTVNPDLTFDNPGTVMNDPNRWQALHFLGGQIDQFGNPINESTQSKLTPFWGDVDPFSMTSSNKTNGVYHDLGPQPHLGGVGDAQVKDAIKQVILFSSQLDPSAGAMIDISPAVVGNRAVGTYTDVGHPVNPHTGLPYDPNVVNLADFGRVIAEFWADGPLSSAPPGHWTEISNEVTDKMEDLGIPKKFGGHGPVLGDLEYDLKKYILVTGAVFDAGISAWNHKGVYDSSRPISLIRYMGGLGQSSDPLGDSYHPSGLPLEPGLIEVITSDTTMPGERHEHLAGHEGEIAIRTWPGPIDETAPFEPDEFSGSEWILATTWMPYQLRSFVTPPFPGYISGHSTFSRSAAEVLAALTGTPYFPGGIFEWHFDAGEGIDFEYGPTTDMTLQWATYFDASDEAGISRIYGGIHPYYDDLPARVLGQQVGLGVWNAARAYFMGVPEPTSALLLGAGAVWLARRRLRS